ncbi:nuclear transport factor 2 family protein [Micromonospora sp. NBC_01412]|uniref:nuclear transport factor 2 family protein n=1 Tax=Micromonospora sp. NBC_01412 TaxID=2903590 RepID=UPI003243F5EA
MTENDPIAALERRVRELEDRLALLQILASYGPGVDSGAATATAELWTEDGTYDTDLVTMAGRTAIADMVTSDRHHQLIEDGSAHLQGIPHIQVTGDTAVVTAYSQLVLRNRDSDSYRIWRTGVNRWEFIRTAEGWKATHRINRQLDGSVEARDLLGTAVNGTPSADRQISD